MEEMEQSRLYESAGKKISILEVLVQPEDYAESCRQIADLLKDAGDYKDAPVLAEKYLKEADAMMERAGKEKYEKAEKIIREARTVSDFDRGIALLRELGTYSDAAKKAEEYRNKKLRFIRKQNIQLGIRILLFLAVVIAGIYTLKGWLDKRSAASGQENAETEATVDPSDWNTGDKVVFGDYKWKVLDVNQEEALLIAVSSDEYDTLSDVAFHENEESVTWENSSLRSWLNGEFLTQSFTEEERKRILKKHLVNADNSRYGTDAGADTEDFVFILSEQEAEQYWNGIKTFSLNWMLRTPGNAPETVMYLTPEHQIRTYGTLVTDRMYIRPVICVSTEQN